MADLGVAQKVPLVLLKFYLMALTVPKLKCKF